MAKQSVAATVSDAEVSRSTQEKIASELQAIRLLLEELVRRSGSPAKQARDPDEPEDLWLGNDALRVKAVASQRAKLEKLRDKKELVSAAQLAALLGIGAPAICEAHKKGRMFRVKIGSSYFYPRFFAEPGVERDDLEEVCKALGSLPGVVKLHFFTTRLGPLGNASPLEALAAGKKELVLAAATARVDL